jgi:hypothetical protein
MVHALVPQKALTFFAIVPMVSAAKHVKLVRFYFIFFDSLFLAKVNTKQKIILAFLIYLF